MTNKYTAVEGSFSYLFAVLIYLVFSLIFGLIANAFGGTGAVVVNFIFSFVVQCCFVAVCFIPTAVFNSRMTYAPKKTSVSKCVVAVMIGVVCYACFSGISLSFNEALYRGGYPTEPPLGVTALVFTAISAILFAPVGEEFLFRGAVLSSLTVLCGKKQSTRNLFAVIVCGLLFSFMHMNPLQTVYQFMLGCALAFAVVKMGNIVPAIIIHAVSNLIGVIMCIPVIDAAVISWITSVFAAGWSTAIFIVASVALAALGGFIVYFLCKKFADKPQPKGEIICDISHKEKGGNMSAALILIPAALICLISWIITLLEGLTGTL